MASSKRDKDGLFRRGGIYYCWVRGKRISTKCRSRKAALGVRDQLERAISDPVYRASITSTVGEFAAVTLDEVQRRGRSESTVEYYRSKLGQVVRGFGAETRLDELNDAAMVDTYIDARRGEGASQHTISKELGALRHMLRVAKRRGAFPGDIDRLFPVGFASGYEPRRRSLSVEEIEALLHELTPKRQAWVAFAIVTGARDSEIARARREDVSPTLDVVQVRGTKTELADDAVAVPVAFRWLLDLALEHGEAEGELVGSWDNAVRDLAAACKRAGIDRAGPNDLRRTHGTLLRAAGASIDVVARQLRHVDSRMAERVYARLTAEQVAGLLPGKPAVQIQHSGDIVETEGSESSGVSEGNRTPDNWSHKPVADTSTAAFAEESEGAEGAGDVGGDDAPTRHSTAPDPIAELFGLVREAGGTMRLHGKPITAAELRQVLGFSEVCAERQTATRDEGADTLPLPLLALALAAEKCGCLR